MENVLECPICHLSLLQSQSSENADPQPVEVSEPLLHPVAVDAYTDSGRTREDRYTSPIRMYPVCTPCGHMFHKACIQEWFKVRRNFDPGTSMCPCPSCRRSISYHKLVRVYLPTPSSFETSPQSSSSIPSRGAITSAVRRYNEQHIQALSLDQSSRSTAPRIYTDFFSFFNSSGNSTRSSDDDTGSLRRYVRDSLRDETGPELACESEDCIALQNVYRILTVEFKHQKRRLQQEIDISKMKSILVTGLQREVDQLRKSNARYVTPGEKLFWNVCLSVLILWLAFIAFMVIF